MVFGLPPPPCPHTTKVTSRSALQQPDPSVGQVIVSSAIEVQM